MRNKFNQILFIAVLFVWIFVSSCQQPDSNSTGSEFMPDMAHSIAYEANTYAYYYNNTWGTKDEYYDFAKPGEPVAGTVARGAAGVSMDDPNSLEKLLSFNGELTHSGISIPANGSVPYNYPDSEAGIQQAAAEMTQNPYPITEDGLASAKELYNVFCGICHGEKGDGLGYLVREDGGKYPAAPANLLLDAYVDMSNGQYYQAIMYGKNLMGAYKDKLSHEERWQVIHYIRTLQAKDRKLEYSEEANTLNNTATPGSLAMSLSDKYDQEMEARREAAMKNSSSHGHDSHGEDHGHDDHGHDNHGDDHGHDDHGHDSHGEDHGDGGHSHDGDDHGNHDGGH